MLLKQYIKTKIKNQVFHYIEEHKKELANDLYINSDLAQNRYNELKTVNNYNSERLEEQRNSVEQKEQQFHDRICFLEREHGRRQWEHVWYAYSRWWTLGPTKELLKEFEYKERFFDFWEDEQPAYWLIYISCLLELDDKKKAADIARKYSKYYDSTEVFKAMPAASLFSKLGIYKDDAIDKSAYIRDKLLKRQCDKVLENYLVNAKSIAIVGNSRCEAGKGLGKEIDEHDVVIRINDATWGDKEKTIDDYGKKCDIWARNGEGERLTNVIDVCYGVYPDFVVYCDDYEHGFVYEKDLLELFYTDVKSENYLTCTMTSESHFELRNKSGIINPSSGAYIIWFVHSLLGNFDKVDFYGFSFMEMEIKKNDYDAELFSGFHSMSREMLFLNELCVSNN